MTPKELLSLRLQNQRLLDEKFSTVEEAVAWFGATQAQDVPAAKWSLGQRVMAATDEKVEEAFNAGKFLRTHVMRPTWHFIMPEDIRWMLELTGPRIAKFMAGYNKQQGITSAILDRAHKIIEKSLQGGNFLNRRELLIKLQEGGIKFAAKERAQMLSYLMIAAEISGLICSGPKVGKQYTYALLEERVPKAARLSRDEALVALAQKFFQAHGPALAKDFSWWSGLTVTDANKAIEALKPKLESAIIEGKEYWFFSPPTHFAKAIDTASPQMHFLANYDEYTCYSNHELHADPGYMRYYMLKFPHYIVINGYIAASWRRDIVKDKVVVTTRAWRNFTNAELAGVKRAAKDYANFLGLNLELKLSTDAGR